MKFNIAFCGPESYFHMRRDFILALKYTLEDLGHDVILSAAYVDNQRFNLLMNAYWLGDGSFKAIHESGAAFAHINAEIIAGDLINQNPSHGRYLDVYLPSMQRGAFVWDVVMDNMTDHARHGTRAHFLRWGWHEKLQDIEHRQEKDLDFYLFGLMSDRRKLLVSELLEAGLSGLADNSCPYFVRNDRIARARVQLNLVQSDRYTHVNSFRICYLANNGCCILSEPENDPAGYLRYTEVATADELVARVREYAAGERWKLRGARALADFMQQPMRESMAALLDASFPA